MEARKNNNQGVLKMEQTNDNRKWYREHYLKSKHWLLLRKEALGRSGGMCAACRKPRQLDPHHLAYRNIFDVTAADLICLCRPCHTAAHEAIDRGIVPHPSESSGGPKIARLLVRCIGLKRDLPFKPLVMERVVLPNGLVTKVLHKKGESPKHSVRSNLFQRVMAVLEINKHELSYCIRTLTRTMNGASFEPFRKQATVDELICILKPILTMCRYREFSEPPSDAGMIGEEARTIIQNVVSRNAIPKLPPPMAPPPDILVPRVEKNYGLIKTQLSIDEYGLTQIMNRLRIKMEDGFKNFKRFSTTEQMLESLRIIAPLPPTDTQ